MLFTFGIRQFNGTQAALPLVALGMNHFRLEAIVGSSFLIQSTLIKRLQLSKATGVLLAFTSQALRICHRERFSAALVTSNFSSMCFGLECF